MIKFIIENQSQIINLFAILVITGQLVIIYCQGEELEELRAKNTRRESLIDSYVKHIGALELSAAKAHSELKKPKEKKKKK